MTTETDTTSADVGASALLRAIEAAKAMEAAARERGLDRKSEVRLRAAWREADRLADAALRGDDDEARRFARVWFGRGEDAGAPAFDHLDAADALHRVEHRISCVQAAAETLDRNDANAIVPVLQDARAEMRRVVATLECAR